MTISAAFFFKETQGVTDEMGDFFSFTWASYAGLRELWWQTRGFKSCYPDISDEELYEKFFSGLQLPGRVDLKTLCINMDWEEHEYRFSSNLIFNACTLFETWMERVCSYTIPSSLTWFQKALQCPLLPNTSNLKTHIDCINYIKSNKSMYIDDEILPILIKHKANSWSRLNSLLMIYTYFKSIRNNLVHSGGVVTQTIVNKQNALIVELLTNGNPVKGIFEMPTQVLGERIKLPIKDSINLYSVLKCLIFTYDAALSTTKYSEETFKQRLRDTVENKKHSLYRVPVEIKKRNRALRSILLNAKLPTSIDFDNFYTYLLAKRIISQ
ncbi:hypothetical protein RSJ44_003001 [Yersinia enterocolitica]|uniref:hypothetical protein n=1 Tax=Yersinia enterocolitica TaxID=630 RepID=UPI0028B53EAD|nr:hypothetical protein [Yersinia enterocolitica]EKN3983610.1 hypothetical protein [Yersinia enterocolitica]EKN5941864.1 hypothetical protein [Yersinia enterocolitica]EKN6225381.1 hypothetical protein [Yersinia enterocolitica]ELI8406322.1 hypothetical protein [Yersinia enterocolitica]